MSETEKKLAGFTRRLRNQNTVEFRSTDQDNYTSLKTELNVLRDNYVVLESRVKEHTFLLASHDEAISELQKTINNLPIYLNSFVFDQINFNLTPASTTMAQGRMLWNSEYSTVMLGIDADVDLAIGQAMYKRIRNNTGSTIIKGQVLYVTGSHGAANITVALANASSETTAATTIGVAAEDIGNNTEGFIITQGYLKGINTNNVSGTGNEGSILWLSTTNGAFTYNRPQAPNHGVVVGWMVKEGGGGAGSIYVNITNGQELSELHDVFIVNKTNKDIIQWNSAQLRWENKSITNADIAEKIHTHLISDLTSLTQMTLVGRWASAGTGTGQAVTIGNGLKLSNTGELSTNSAQVVDTTTSILTGIGLVGGGNLTQNRTISIDFAANGEVSSTKAVRADDSRLSGSPPSTGLFDIDGGDATVYTGTPILDGGVA